MFCTLINRSEPGFRMVMILCTIPHQPRPQCGFCFKPSLQISSSTKAANSVFLQSRTGDILGLVSFRTSTYKSILKSVAFAAYFESQNEAIYSGKLRATPINLVALGINNGWYDAIIQEREFISFSVNNSYYPLINESIADAYLADYNAISLPALEKCTQIDGDVEDCFAGRAAIIQVDNKWGAYYPSYDFYDIRQTTTPYFPPETYSEYLNDPAVQKAIGAKVAYTDCSDAAEAPFGKDGDSMCPETRLPMNCANGASVSFFPPLALKCGEVGCQNSHLGRRCRLCV